MCIELGIDLLVLYASITEPPLCCRCLYGVNALSLPVAPVKGLPVTSLACWIGLSWVGEKREATVYISPSTSRSMTRIPLCLYRLSVRILGKKFLMKRMATPLKPDVPWLYLTLPPHSDVQMSAPVS